jgi:endoglucanase
MPEPTQGKSLLPRAACLLLMLALVLGAIGRTAAQSAAAEPAGQIRINQLGFLPAARKLAIVESSTARSFTVVRSDNSREVLKGELQPAATWALAQRPAMVADLSALTSPGAYRVIVAGLPPSDSFPINAKVYAGIGDAALKAYYFQRASTAVDAKYAGIYARKAGHHDTEVEVHASAASAARPAGTVISAPRGWYDAGDYNKYIVNSGISTWTLLAALDHFPAFHGKQDLDIPESGDKVPDILDEARWNLLWMLDMQDPGDGGVYHKLTTLRFDGMEMPERDLARRYVVQKATAATLDFAAVMAMASRLHAPYEKQFPGVAARMRKAAEAAWGWAKANPAVAYQQPGDVVTGAYGDRRFDDEFAWAGAELFLLTGNGEYLRDFPARTAAPVVPSWSDVATLGLISLARHRGKMPTEERKRVEEQLVALAEKLATQWQASPWKVAMQASDMVWGSNAVVLNQAMVLLQGHWLTGKRDYLDAAQSQFDYILGRNPLGVSFVTGYGIRTPMHIHHRPSEADGIDAPVPGMLSGGPNPGKQDARDCPVQYASSIPALAWLDHACSYASNEIAINWNAPLVYVAAALQQPAGAKHN